MPTICRFCSVFIIGLLATGLLTGCEEKQTAPSSYVARVGDHYLHQDEIERMLKGLGPVPDSTEARQQVINQWVEHTLLLREANRLNLPEDTEVKRQLEEQRQNTLITALKQRIYEEIDQSPSKEEIRTYFERHQDKLTLREPHVRVRHLSTQSKDSARAALETLRQARPPTRDSIWARLSRRYAQRPSNARDLADRFVPENQLFAQLPYVKDELTALQEGEFAPVIRDSNRFHLLQLVRRAEGGTPPELQWIETEIRRRLQVRHRKQMYAREVQRLRNRAKADGRIETP